MTQNIRFQRFGRAAVLAGAAALAVSGLPGSAQAQGGAGELVLAQGADPLGFNPTRFSAPNTSYLHQLYDTLVRVDAAGTPVAGLAESWERSEDGLTVTFKLREAKFHTGRPITAEDVVFSIKYHQDQANGANLMGRIRSITEAAAPDADTVVLTLSSLTPGLYDLLGALFILDSEKVADMATTDAGSGPFRLVEWRPGVSYTMERFADHWANDQTTLDRITVRIIPDDAAAAASLLTGSVDVLYTAGPLALAQIEGAGGIHIARAERAPRTHYLGLNTSRAPLDNKLVRQAISHSINRELIGEIVYDGNAVAGCQPWPATHWAHDAAVEDLCSFDLDAARALMAQSGVGPFTITVNTSTDAYAPGSVDGAQILREDLAQIGIALEIATYEPARARELLIASDWDVLSHNYIEGGNDPQFIMPSAIYGPEVGRTKFASEQLTELIGAAGRTTDLAQRKAAYAAVSAYIADEAFMLPFLHEFRPIPMADGVSGLEMDGSGFAILQRVTVAR